MVKPIGERQPQEKRAKVQRKHCPNPGTSLTPQRSIMQHPEPAPLVQVLISSQNNNKPQWS
jgi:hypothetical protein